MGELLYGSPAHRPLAQTELLEWLALLNVIEPMEHEEALAAAKERQQQGR